MVLLLCVKRNVISPSKKVNEHFKFFTIYQNDIFQQKLAGTEEGLVDEDVPLLSS